jgi:hypothetical protein
MLTQVTHMCINRYVLYTLTPFVISVLLNTLTSFGMRKRSSIGSHYNAMK